MPQEEKEKTPGVITDEIATASKDFDIFSGWLNRLENPDPTLRTEAAGKGLKLYDEVDRDPHAGAVLQSRYLSVISKEWEVLPGEEPTTKGRPATVTQAQKVADFVKQTLLNTNFDQARQELLQAVLYGFYVGEVIWEVKDNAIVPQRIRAKHPRRFSFTMDRELRLLTLQDMIEGEPVPDRKFIRFTYGSSDNPYGKGLGQKLWWPIWFKKNGIKFWLVFLEKFGMPTAVGKYPPGTLPEQQKALLDAIDAIQNETGIKIPDSMSIDLLEAARSGKVTYETICEYMDKQVSKAVLGQTATTEGTPGKLGNEQSQEETKQDIVEADAGLLDECLNNSIVRWIVDYNYPGITAYPKIQTRVEAEKDLKALAERDSVLIKDIGLDIGKRYFYETYAIPEPEEDEALVEPQGPDKAKVYEYHLKYGLITINEVRARLGLDPAPGGDRLIEPQGPTNEKPGGGQFALRGVGPSPPGRSPLRDGVGPEAEDLSPADTLDALGEKTLKAANLDGLMKPVEDLLASVNSLGEFRDGLLDLYGDMDESILGDLMQRAFTVAELAGRFDVIER